MDRIRTLPPSNEHSHSIPTVSLRKTAYYSQEDYIPGVSNLCFRPSKARRSEQGPGSVGGKKAKVHGLVMRKDSDLRQVLKLYLM